MGVINRPVGGPAAASPSSSFAGLGGVVRSEVSFTATGTDTTIVTPTANSVIVQCGFTTSSGNYPLLGGTSLMNVLIYQIRVAGVQVMINRYTWQSTASPAYGSYAGGGDVPLSLPIYVPANTSISAYVSNTTSVAIGLVYVNVLVMPVSALKRSF